MKKSQGAKYLFGIGNMSKRTNEPISNIVSY